MNTAAPAIGFSLSFFPCPRLYPEGHEGFAEGGGIAIAYDGLVYGVRGEAPILPTLSDRERAERLLAIYRRAPEAFFERLDAQGTVVVVTERYCYAFRSRLSPRPLYYSERFASNRLLPLWLAEERPALDVEYCLAFLLDIRAMQYDQGVTPFCGIRRLLPGQLLVAHGEGYEIKEIARKPQYFYAHRPEQSFEEAVAGVRSHIEAAVDTRLGDGQRPVVCELSGGLDSSYIAALVARRVPKVSAFMYSFPKFPSHLFSERCARQVADHCGISLTVLTPDALPPVDLSTNLPYRDEPSDFFWQGGLFGPPTRDLLPEKALLFGGFGADQIFLCDRIVMPWLLRRGHVRTFFSMLTDTAKSIDRSRAHLLWQSLLLQLPKSSYQRLSQRFAGWRFNPFNLEEMEPNALLLEPVPWLQYPADAATRLGGGPLDVKLTEGKVRLEFDYLVAPNLNTDPYYETKGVRSAHPYCDSRLIDYVLNDVDWSYIHDFKNPYKHLLREAQRGLVPEEVRTRPKNEFVFNGFLADVLRQNESYLRELVGTFEAPAPIRLSAEGMRRSLDEMLFGLGNNAGGKLLNVIGFALWWREFKNAADKATEKRGKKRARGKEEFPEASNFT